VLAEYLKTQINKDEEWDEHCDVLVARESPAKRHVCWDLLLQ